MMVHIVVLISACALSIVLGMLLTALCVASGNAEREDEYQRHVDRLVTLLKGSNEELDRWHRDACAAPPDEDDGCEPEADRMLYGVTVAIRNLLREALVTDGAHHKQWFIEAALGFIGETHENLIAMGYEWEKGIAP